MWWLGACLGDGGKGDALSAGGNREGRGGVGEGEGGGGERLAQEGGVMDGSFFCGRGCFGIVQPD